MKRQILLWLDTFPHKPKWLKKQIKWLKRQIDLDYWAYLANIQEEKKKHQSKLEKRLSEFEAKWVKDINILKEPLFGHDSDTVMTKLTFEEANKKMIEMMKKDGLETEEISDRLEFLGFKNPEPKFSENKPNWKACQWTDPVAKKTYNIIEKMKKKTNSKGVKQNGKSKHSAPKMGARTNGKRKSRTTNPTKPKKLLAT
jgi:hypothetical protein